MPENEPMPKSMQIRMLQDKFKKQGIDTATIDFEAEVDDKLRYPENEQNLLAKHGTMTEEQMYNESTGGQVSSDIEKLKSQMVRRDEVANIIEEKLKKLNSMKQQIAIQQGIPVQAKAQAVNTLDKELTKQNSILSRLKNLKGVAYRKIIVPYEQRKETQKQTQIQQRAFLKDAMQQGMKQGYRQAYKQYGGQLARVSIMKQQKPQFRQMVQSEVNKQKMALAVKMEADRQLARMKFEQDRRRAIEQEMLRRQRQQMPNPNIRINQRMQVMIPPHVPQPNILTGVCRICGQKHTRIL